MCALFAVCHVALCCSTLDMRVQACIWVANAWFCPVPFEFFRFCFLLIPATFCWLICHYLCPAFCCSFIVIYFIYFFTYFSIFLSYLHVCSSHSLMFSFLFIPSSHFSYSVLPSCHLPDHILTHIIISVTVISGFPPSALWRFVVVWALTNLPKERISLVTSQKDLNPHLQRCQPSKLATEICFKLLIR
jgi:hypothetical protein